MTKMITHLKDYLKEYIPESEQDEYQYYTSRGDKICQLEMPEFTFGNYNAVLVEDSNRKWHDATGEHDEWIVYYIRGEDTDAFVKVEYGFSSYDGAYYNNAKEVHKVEKTIQVWENL